MTGRMGAFINQHSFLLAALLLAALAGWVTRRRRPAVRLAALGGVLAVAVLAFVLLRTPSGEITSAADLDRALGGGRPVALELYSNY